MKKTINSMIMLLGLMSSSMVMATNALPAYFSVNLKDAKQVVLQSTVFDKDEMFVFIDKDKPECQYMGKMTEQGNISVFDQKCKDKLTPVDYFAFERDFNNNPRFFPSRVGTSYLVISRQAIKERAPTKFEKTLKSYKGFLDESQK